VYSFSPKGIVPLYHFLNKHFAMKKNFLLFWVFMNVFCQITTAKPLTETIATPSLGLNAPFNAFADIDIPQGSLTANGPFCSSGTGQLTWTATTGVGPFTVVYNDGTADRVVSNITNGQPFDVFVNAVTSTTTYTLVSVIGTDFGVRTTGFTGASATITVNTPPNIAATGQPIDVTVCAETPVKLSVTATGSGLTYQWQKEGVDIGGETAATYKIAASAAVNAGLYRVVVSGTCTPSVISDPAVVVVNALPEITKQPIGSTICAGAAVPLAVEATGVVTYKWTKNGANIGTYSPNNDISASNVGDAGTYRVVVSNANCSKTSSPAVVVVNTLPSIQTQPIASTVCAGAAINLSVVATGAGLTYQWKRGTANILNATSATFTNPSSVAGDAGSYSVVVSGTCTPSVSSTSVAVVVNALPTITLAAVPAICAGSTAFAIPITAATNITTPITYSISGTGITAVTAPLASPIRVNLSSPAVSGTTSYTLIVKNGNGCTSSPNSGSVAILPTGVGTLEGDRLALIDLYNATGGATWTNKAGWIIPSSCGQSPCGWYGVKCVGDRVTEVSFPSNNNLTGSIPASIGDLTNLTTLNFSNNLKLIGTLPREIGKLTNLTALNLLNNKLTGSIPSEIGNLTKLTTLNLSNNQLTGSIPSEIGNLTKLTTLNLGANQLTGSIPSEIGNLSTLIALNMSSNQLTSIPTSIGDLTKLTGLNMSSNQLTSIPISIESLTSLTSLNLSFNKLTSISTSISNLANLAILTLSFNQLTGSIPIELVKLTNLQSLNLSFNQLTGSIPIEIGKLTNLQSLNLSSNQLTGSIPIEVGKLLKLASLSLTTNQLTGTIPSEIGNLPNLQALVLTANQLTGSIPTEIVNLTRLSTLYLDTNRLTGSIPVEIGKLINLGNLRLGSNQLTGAFNLTGVRANANVRIQNNKFNFDGIETNIALLDSITPQSNIPITNTIGVLSVNAGGTLENNTYKWYKKDPITPTLLATNVGNASFTPTMSGTYYVHVTNSKATALTLISDEIVVTIPQGSLTANTLCGSGTGQLTWTATEGTAPFTIIYNDGTADRTLTNVASGTPFDVFTNPVESSKAYTLVSVTGSGADASVRAGGFTVGAATVTVNTLPKINAEPVESTTLCAGVSTTLKVVAMGTGLTYQWKKDGVNIADATAATYVLASATSDTASKFIYTVTVGGTCTPSVNSATSTVIVNALPKITAQPTAATTVCAGSKTVNLSVGATGTGLTYKWKKGGIDITDATAATYDVTSTTTDIASTSIYTVVVGGTCTPSVISSDAVVTVNALLNVTVRPSDLTNVCIGTKATLSVTATGSGLTYQWKKDSVDITGATKASYTIDTATVLDAGVYSVVVGSTCSPKDTSAKTVLVIDLKPSDIIGTPSVNATFSTALTNTVAGGQWSSNDTTIAKVNAVTGVVTGIFFGTTTINYTVANACGVITVKKEFTVVRNTVLVSLKAFLQGPYNANTGFMDATLRVNGYLPSVEPYTGMSNFIHKGNGGGELFDSPAITTIIGNNAIVDWVFIELRDKTTPSKVVATRSALIQRDGDIVDTDGTSALLFNDVIAGDYHIAVRHRNHLGFRTSTSKPLTTIPLSLNFTDGSTPIFGSNPLKLIGSAYVMYGGNGDSNSAINAIDKNSVWLKANGQFNYLRADFNMDGAVNAADRNDFWLLNNSRVQQLD
jgi:Leucine-rich repeat (LRR) protein